MRVIAPIPKQFEDSNGVPYANGKVTVYLHGSTSLARIYKEAEGDALAPNPTILDSHGAWNAFVNGGTAYDYVVQDEHDNVIFSYSNVKVYGYDDVVGDGAVGTQKAVEGGATYTHVYIKANSIDRGLLKNAHNLVADSRYLQLKDFDGKVVVTLCDALQAWLETEGYTA